MIIGITGNTKSGKEKISNYLQDKYKVRYIDIDKKIEELLLVKEIYGRLQEDDWYNDIPFVLELKHKIDNVIKVIVDNSSNDEILVLDYSLLEDSYIIDKCQAIIKVNDYQNVKLANQTDIIRFKRQNDLNYKHNDRLYQLQLELDKNWQDKLDEYFDYNLFHKSKVTVVVPIHNTAKYLLQCVKSITSQTYTNLEILLIDDGSTDESLELCHLLASQDSRIKVIHQDNIGLAETRNKGIQLATGEYICFIDSDDYIENSMIEKLLKRIEETNADVCEGSFYIHFKNGEIRDVTCEQKDNKYIEGKLNLINAYSNATILIPAWDKIYRLSSIKDVKFDKNCFKEDTDYIYKLCMLGKTFALVNIPFYHYIKRKSGSITSDKISPRLFTLRKWGWEAYNEVLSQGTEYQDAAEKILYNSLVHILRYYMRDYKNNVLSENEYKEEIQTIVNELIILLLNSKNVGKFRKLDEVLSIINELIDAKRIDKEKMPQINLPCIGILWNSLNKEMMEEAIEIIKQYATITGIIYTDLEEKYREFINDIYFYNHEFEGIPVIKAGTLIDKYDSNTIVILNMVIKVTNYFYQNKLKGYMFKEVAELKNLIRKYFKMKIVDYAYDNVFHLTVDDDEYEYTDEVCKKYIKQYKSGDNNGKR